MRTFWLSSRPAYTQFLLIMRLFIGAMFIRHGLGLFNAQGLADNAQWLRDVSFPIPEFSAYLGKSAELLGGILLMLGLCVRPIAIPVVFTMGVIVFVRGNGEIFGERTYPFLLMLSYACFFLTGPGKWSFDYLLFDRPREKAATFHATYTDPSIAS